jgi:hypothetical protein
MPHLFRPLKIALLLVGAMFWGTGCTRGIVPDTIVVSTDLSIRRLTPNVWLHVTNSGTPGEASNGLFIVTPAGVTLVDAGWNALTTRRLLDWSELHLQKKVTAVILTSSRHPAAVKELVARNIPLWAQESHARALAARGISSGIQAFSLEHSLGSGKTRVVAFHPVDVLRAETTIVSFPKDRVLFAGELVKGADVTPTVPSNSNEAAALRAALERVEAKFPRPAIVVPSSGAFGDGALLTRSLQALRERLSRL